MTRNALGTQLNGTSNFEVLAVLPTTITSMRKLLRRSYIARSQRERAPSTPIISQITKNTLSHKTRPSNSSCYPSKPQTANIHYSTSKMAPVDLVDIPTAFALYTAGALQQSPGSLARPDDLVNSRIALIRTDITTLQVDAIVNAANESLLGGGGVDGAIHRAAGPELVRECASLDGCDTGSAKITAGYKLPARHVIHAVGPVYSSSGKDESAELLAGCYGTSLKLAVEKGCKSVAFSALSTGVYGYPSEDAADIACQTVRHFLDNKAAGGHKIERVIFCNFLEKDEKAYGHAVPKWFPRQVREEE